MTRLGEVRGHRAWKDFVIAHGHHAVTTHLAFVLGRPVAEIRRLRAAGVCSKDSRRKTFAELFRLWHGREATDDEWPVPAKAGRGGYEWQGPELALLASLVGRIGKPEIAQVLTERLRRLTGDATATRNPTSVQMAIGRIGMQRSVASRLPKPAARSGLSPSSIRRSERAISGHGALAGPG